MYRVFCESFPNLLQDLGEDNYRARIIKPLELIVNIEKYKQEKAKESELYKRLSDLIIYMQNNVKKYPRLKAFLWTIEGKDIVGKEYNISEEEELEEQTKIVKSILKLAYWY